MLEPYSISYLFDPVEDENSELDQIFSDRLQYLPGVIDISGDQCAFASGVEIESAYAESTARKITQIIKRWKDGFSITYDIVTPESAEHGDYEESGYITKGLTLAQAVQEITEYSPGEAIEPSDSWADSARWITFYNVSGENEGRVKSIALHFPKRLNAVTRKRICGLFTSLKAWEI